ncbi:MAG: hypothetical protein IPP37_07425 [Saprospiraceae bacterium]|nr:hypothetical protein [Saprospiraceae bacterium]
MPFWSFSVLFNIGQISGLKFGFTILGLSLCTVLYLFFPSGSRHACRYFAAQLFTGVAAACGVLLYGNYVMLIGCILVGSAGTISYSYHV